MVVSKDSKRKRKESPPPQTQSLPPPQQPPVQSSTSVAAATTAAAAAAAVESSPEVPKRAKVQAQRKFAQGQCAPASSYNSIVTASALSNATPGTSSESREPPTEILPNKRPKAEDFLTFLCFRGTSALPANCDFFNEGGSSSKTKNAAKEDTAKATAKKGKKGRPKAGAKTVKQNAAAASTTKAATAPDVVEAAAITAADSLKENTDKKDSAMMVANEHDESQDDEALIVYAARKRAETLAEGNRRGRTSAVTPADETNKNVASDAKRRSNRKDAKSSILTSEPTLANDTNGKPEETDKISELKNSKTPPVNAQQETDVVKTRKGRVSNANKKPENALTNHAVSPADVTNKSKENVKNCSSPLPSATKEKPTAKRPRVKESPIFIPSPEPSGRMTRQRAFFEPVKVPHREETPTEAAAAVEKKSETLVVETTTEISKANDAKEPQKKPAYDNAVKEDKLDNSASTSADKTNDKSKSLNVFDFSSDDEQPLAKTLKMKNNKESPKKPNQRSGNKTNLKQLQKKDAKKTNETPLTKGKEAPNAADAIEETIESPQKVATTPTAAAAAAAVDVKEQPMANANNNTSKRGRATKKKAVDEKTNNDVDSKPTSPKKNRNARQARGKANANANAHETTSVEEAQDANSSAGPTRSQRPTRKTKEAAAIYMGIIGHKLQLADDEDDDLSLNSFPDLPNVKEMEKMEFEIKKNATQGPTTSATTSINTTITTTTTAATVKPTVKTLPSVIAAEKPATVRRGRPPKGKPTPPKRDLEATLAKADCATGSTSVAANDANKDRSEHSKADSEDEDFLLNKEVNETKRKLEKSFSDSDDEPLAIKVHVKSSDKDLDKTVDSAVQCTTPTALATLVSGTKTSTTPPLMTTTNAHASPVNVSMQTTTSQAPSPFKTIEKKSPVPTSKILNVPATYGVPANTLPLNVVVPAPPGYSKTTTYMPQASPHFHPAHVRPGVHQFPPTKSPTGPPPTIPPHLAVQMPPQSPSRYQTPPAYPPPIDAYPQPKINPNFLTPKFDRAAIPRPNSFPSPSPVNAAMGTPKAGPSGSMQSPKTSGTAPSTSAGVAHVATSTANDPLKDEIGSILAANLMPSKEESGKIFGIASVSLAQSSGPDNTKCTLGKCGSIHKPVLGPVVPTEGYIGDQLSSKERRKAKVNMTHEQIQKWLLECSSEPDEIQDDLDDDFDDLRSSQLVITPPPTREEREAAASSSTSRAARELARVESIWPTKVPALKPTAAVATTTRRDEESTSQTEAVATEIDNSTGQAINLAPKIVGIQNSNGGDNRSKDKEKSDKKTKEDKTMPKEVASRESNNKQAKTAKDKELPTTSANAAATTVATNNKPATGRTAAAMAANVQEKASSSPKQRGKKTGSSAATIEETSTSSPVTKTTSTSTGNTSSTPLKSTKRTPVYSQKNQKPVVLKVSTTTSHRKSAPFSYGAFSADNERSVYSFDKDDDEEDTSKTVSKPSFRRQSRRDSPTDEATNTTTPSRSTPSKRRAAAAAAEKANKEIANANANAQQNSSVSLTLSPTEKSKLVKVCLDAENAKQTAAKGAKDNKKSETVEPNNETADSDSEGHTFYIPLQGSGVGGESEGGIQGVAVKLGREGPDGPNQKVIMHATLVTKAQMGTNPKPLPESMNVSDIVKTLINSSSQAGATVTSTTTIDTTKKGIIGSAAVSTVAVASTSAAAAAAAVSKASSTSGSLKNVPIGTVQPRFKATETTTTVSAAQPATGTTSSLVRVNSNSSLFSGSAKSRANAPGATAHAGNKKFKDDTPIKMSNNTAFPRHDDPTQMVEAPIFRPTEKEFADPIEFIERITPIAARFGICKIIPPPTFKPECRISDEMRFTAYNQYVHKMLHRWGPSAKELSAIKKYLATQSIVMNHPPWIGGMEVDLPRLYHTVQELGGLKEVIEKKKWARVAEEMCIPKLAQDRVTKLDDIYCKYLLPYDTLSQTERQKLFDEVEADWAKREARARRNADRFVNTESVSNEEDDVSSEDDEESEDEVDGVSMECIVKGRSMPLSQFYRIARNTMALWFKNTEPIVTEVEAEFWRHVAVRDSHVCVHSGSIDSSGWGYGFPSPGPKGKGSNYARHPWNLKVLTNNPGSVLRSLGPVMGVTVPTLHVGMLFSAGCWYRDPHGLSWIEYLHTGASKLWYGIPDDQSANFRAALTSLIPTHCQNKTIWLPCDTVMVPPHMLTDRGVSLCRIEQKPGEFIVVFPRAYTSSLATGYVVSESVYFATSSWLELAKEDFRDIHDSCEPAMFSLEQLLFALGYDQRVASDTLQQMLPMLKEVYEKETAAREQLKAAGVISNEKVSAEKGAKAKKQQQPPFKSIDSECDLCRANLYISMVKTDEGNVYCLQHALKNLNNGNIQAKQCKLIYAYNAEDILVLMRMLQDKIQQKRTTATNKKAK